MPLDMPVRPRLPLFPLPHVEAPTDDNEDDDGEITYEHAVFDDPIVGSEDAPTHAEEEQTEASRSARPLLSPKEPSKEERDKHNLTCRTAIGAPSAWRAEEETLTTVVFTMSARCPFSLPTIVL